ERIRILEKAQELLRPRGEDIMRLLATRTTLPILRFLAAVSVATVAILVEASPAAAQWTRVTEIPITNIYSVWIKDNTILATADSVVYISTDGGAGWKESADVADDVVSVQGASVRNGRLYVGTYGQGVFISDDLGDSWQAYNQGLVGGVLDTQRFVIDLLIRGDSLYLATAGDGPWVRNLTVGTWTHFSNVFEPNQASNMNDIAASATQLVGSAGFNGTIFSRDPGQADWTLSWLNNVGIAPGLAALSAIWNGRRWVVGANIGVFYGESGQSPWTFSDIGLGTLFSAVFALRGSDVFAAFGAGTTAIIEYSLDSGATWHLVETLPNTFIFGLAVKDDMLYGARADGLWRRSIATVAVHTKSWGSVKALYRKPRK
ncbi:MAG: glycoside hydrolase, partial [Candidatus Latescibacteria bacterium]|nr:glycoside hydrolase [Candidatus Latescibacterota bacterium]